MLLRQMFNEVGMYEKEIPQSFACALSFGMTLLGTTFLTPRSGAMTLCRPTYLNFIKPKEIPEVT